MHYVSPIVSAFTIERVRNMVDNYFYVSYIINNVNIYNIVSIIDAPDGKWLLRFRRIETDNIS